MAVVVTACSSAGGVASSGAPDGGASSSTDAGNAPASDASAPSDAGKPSSDASVTDAGAATTTFRVHYPAGAHHLTLRGSAGPLTWTQGVALAAGANDTWTYATDQVTAVVDFKPMLDDDAWSRGPNYRALPGQTVDIYPHFVTVAGSYSRKWPSFTSTVLPSRVAILGVAKVRLPCRSWTVMHSSAVSTIDR